MSRISGKFAELAGKGEKALITFITAGDPDLATTEELILQLERSGADVIELGVPFSDPMADGPTIQLASERALAAGTTLPGILSLVKSVRSKTEIPIILMGYYNPVFLYGIQRFAADASAAGVDGVLLVDLPPEESAEFKAATKEHGLDLIFLLTPTSDKSRISRVAKLGSGFIYYVSVTGVTGSRTEVADSVFNEVAAIRQQLSLPLVVGFGISNAERAGLVAAVADGVVVGWALVKYCENFQGEVLRERLGSFVAGLKAGIAGSH